MYSHLALIPLLFLTAAFQSPGDSIQRHYKAAQDFQNAGRLDEAESEYKKALGLSYRNLARALLAEGKYQKAVRAVESSASFGAGSESLLIDQATAYFYVNQYEKAVEPLKKALAANSRSAAAHHLLGKVYFMLGRFDESVVELDAALKFAPSDFDVSYTLALAHLKRKQPVSAQQIFRRMLARLGDKPGVHNLLGRAYRETGYLDEAMEEFRKAIALDSRHPRAHYNLGLTYLLKDGTLRIKEAAAELRAELAINPQEFLAIYNLGLISVVERQYEEGVRLLEKAALLRPQNPGVCLFLGNAYHGVGRYEKSVEYLKKFLSLDPSADSPQAAEARFLLGQSLVRVGRMEEGEKELEIARDLKAKALATDREKIVAYLNTEEYKGAHLRAAEEEKISSAGSADARTKESEIMYSGVVARIHNQTGLLYAERENFRAAVEHFRSAVEWDSSLAGANYNLGLACYKAELYKEAIPALESALKTDSANITAKHLLGMCYFAADDFAKASTLLSEVLAARPNNVGLYYSLSLSLIKQGKANEAGEVMQRMIALSGDSPQLHILLGQAHHQQHDDVKALEELKKASDMDSRLPLAHFYSGMIHIQRGAFDEAAREFEAELAINPRDLQARYHLGFVLLTRGENQRGMKLMREVIALRPDFADARFELGKAMLGQGDVKGAIEMLESAVSLGPDKSHIHYQLGRAYTAAGRDRDAQKCFDTFKQLKDKERNRTNP
jgi:tetratricopeptide (TPR) repeat protein